MQLKMTIHLKGTNGDVAMAANLLGDIAKLIPAQSGIHIQPGKAKQRGVTLAGGWDAWCEKWLSEWTQANCETCEGNHG